jgi:hypothetical protein
VRTASLEAASGARGCLYQLQKGSLEADELMRHQNQKTSPLLNKDPFDWFKQPPIKLIRKIVITFGASLFSPVRKTSTSVDTSWDLSKSGLAGDPRGN